MNTQNPYEPPKSTHGYPETPGPEHSYGVDFEDMPPGFGIRAGARLIDIVMGYILTIIVGVMVGVAIAILGTSGVLSPDWEARIDTSNPLLGALFGMISTITYHTISEGMAGASLGKLICGLRVVGEDDQKCSFGGAFVRSLGFLIDGMFFGLVGYSSMSSSPLNQRYGDKWARTLVVRANRVPAHYGTGVDRAIIAILLALLVDVLITGAWLAFDGIY